MTAVLETSTAYH